MENIVSADGKLELEARLPIYAAPELVELRTEVVVRNTSGPALDPCSCSCFQSS